MRSAIRILCAFLFISRSSCLVVNFNHRQIIKSVAQRSATSVKDGYRYRQISRSSPKMVFDSLTRSLAGISDMFQGKKRITAGSVDLALVEVRRALLDADVNLKVTNELIDAVRNQAIGKILIDGVSPDQQFIKIMYDELVLLMGASQAPLQRSKEDGVPVVILLAGLQGAGKTTAAVKLARYCQLRGAGVQPATELEQKTSIEETGPIWRKADDSEINQARVLLIACDVYRPAAIEQLEIMGQKINAEVYSESRDADPVEIAKKGIDYAKENKFDAVIVDTAGRQVIDDSLMDELKKIKASSNPDEVLLVVDAMTGQEAATLTAAFNERIGITGAILTKLDGDTRGGSALSVQAVSGKPIKFVGVGEGIDDLEPFYPDRMAGRILGMGDIISFVEKAQKQVTEAEMEKMSKKMLENKFDFNDLLEQSKVMRNMGSMASVAKMIPGIAGKINQQQIDEAEEKAEQADKFISFMLAEERSNPELLMTDPSSASRQRRIAKAAGTRQKEVVSFLNDFQKMRTMMSRMTKKAASGEDFFSDPSKSPDTQDIMGLGNRQQRRQAAKNAKKSTSAPKKGFGSK